LTESAFCHDLIETLEWKESLLSTDLSLSVISSITKAVEIKLDDLPFDHLMRVNKAHVSALSRVSKNPYIAAIVAEEVVADADAFMFFLASAVADSEEAKVLVSRSAPWKPSVSFSRNTMIPPMDRGGTNLTEYNSADSEIVCSKLIEGFEALCMYNPQGANLVNNFIWTLALRREVDEPNAFSSGTFQSAPGLVLICNSHLEGIGALDMAEALLHEAIHCYLFCAEDRDRRILGPNTDYRERVHSPWTGAHIGLHSAVHALAVWFGLLKHFHLLEAAASGALKEIAIERLAFIERGFRSDDFPEFKSELQRKCSDFGRGIVGDLALRIDRVLG
jgi:hypothetical protein